MLPKTDAERQKALAPIASVVRALIASKKPPYRLRDIISEYPQVEGSPLPFRKLGFRTAEELLEETGEFIVSKIGDELFVSATYSSKSDHITAFVLKQKPSKSKALVADKSIIHRKPNNTAKTWNKSTYSSNIFGRLSVPQNKFLVSRSRTDQQHQLNNKGDRNNNISRGTAKLFTPNPTTPNGHQQLKLRRPTSAQSKEFIKRQIGDTKAVAQYTNKQKQNSQQEQYQIKSSNSSNNKPIDLRDKLNAMMQQRTEQKESQKMYPRAILGQQMSINRRFQLQQYEYEVEINTQKILQQQKQLLMLQTQKLETKQGQQFEQKEQMQFRSIQTRLQMQPQQQEQHQQQQKQQHEQNKQQQQKQQPQQQKQNKQKQLKQEQEEQNKQQQLKQQQQKEEEHKQQQLKQQQQEGEQHKQQQLKQKQEEEQRKKQQQKEQHKQQQEQKQKLEQEKQQQQKQSTTTEEITKQTTATQTQTQTQAQLQKQQQQQLLQKRILQQKQQQEQQQQKQTQSQALTQNQEQNAYRQLSIPQQMLPQQQTKKVEQQTQQQYQSYQQHQQQQKQQPNHHHQQQQLHLRPQSLQSATNGYRDLMSIQNRLKVNSDKMNLKHDNSNFAGEPTSSTTSDNRPNNSYANMKKSAVSVLSLKYPVQSLYKYCKLRGFAEPRFSVIQVKYTKCYQCRVDVNGSIYFTYPNEFPTEEVAKIECAIKAIEQIRINESRRPIRPCNLSDTEFIERLHAELLLYPNGLFSKNVPEFYEQKFGEKLPENWWTLVTLNTNKFIVEEMTSATIVFAKVGASEDESITIQMDGITLPWNERYWSLNITYAISPIEVWARLFGAQYSDRFNKMMDEIEQHMVENQERSTAIACNRIHLISISGCWHRVRVLEVNKEKETALLFYIDFGDSDWLPLRMLHNCEPQFLRLPGQAIPFSLFGLEDFFGNPNAIEPLETYLPSGKALVAEVLTKENDFYSETNVGGKIQVVMYDTSSEEDINLNPLILEAINKITAVPTLENDVVINVTISHVSDDGFIHFQMKNSESAYVEKLIYQLVESKFKRDQHKISRADINSTTLFLICDENDPNGETNWYRGKVADKIYDTNDDEFDIIYVDHGFVKRTHISNMYCLESLSAALSKFPSQALKAYLCKIPNIDKEVVGLMRSLMPNNCEAMIKKVDMQNKIPLVKVYRRIPPSSYLVPINNVIRNEYTMGKSIDTPESAPIAKKAESAPRQSPSASSTTTPFNDMIRGLTITTVPKSPTKVAVDLPELKEFDDFPKIGDFFNVYISMVSNPSHITVQPYEYRTQLKNLMSELQEYCEKNIDFIPFDLLKINHAYAAKNTDGFFYRITVRHIISSDMIHVFFCDFGDTITMNNLQIIPLPAKFRQLPKMAITARVWGIEPTEGNYSVEDCERFREQTVGFVFAGCLKAIENDESTQPPTHKLHLDLVDTSSVEDIYLRETFLKELNVYSTID